MGSWSDQAWCVIEKVHASLPESATLDERKAVIDAAYPFGERAHHPYKVWVAARKAYLCLYGYVPRQARHESPLERMIRRAGA